MRRASVLIGVGMFATVQVAAQPVTPPPSTPASPSKPSNISPARVIGTLEFTPDDYPKEALRGNESGLVVLQFVIGVDGKVSECKAWGEYPVLNAVSCALARERWHFVPAIKDGSPIPSLKTQRVRWVIPDTPQAEFQLIPGPIQTVHFTLMSDGSKRDRAVEFGSVQPSTAVAREDVAARTFQVCSNLPHYGIVRDVTGKPVTKRVTITEYAKIEDLPTDVKK